MSFKSYSAVFFKKVAFNSNLNLRQFFSLDFLKVKEEDESFEYISGQPWCVQKNTLL